MPTKKVDPGRSSYSEAASLIMHAFDLFDIGSNGFANLKSQSRGT